mgnify:FL=1
MKNLYIPSSEDIKRAIEIGNDIKKVVGKVSNIYNGIMDTPMKLVSVTKTTDYESITCTTLEKKDGTRVHEKVVKKIKK